MLFNNKQIKNKRFSFVFLSLVLLFSMLLTTAISVRAETFLVNNANDFDNSNVYDDLSSSDINISDYNFDSSGQTEVIQMVEYCFSYDLDYIDNYALYLYVYNPSCTLYDVNNANNTVTMATEYTNGTPTTYTKYDLKFCNKADIYYDRLFYKFRIVDKFENGSSILTRVYNQFISDSTDNELTEVSRSYSISEIELCYNNTMTAINVSQSYSFTGFASGYGSEESTLECNASKLETIQIDEIYSTYYRPDGVSSLGENHQWQLNSVYFAIPDKYTDNYGELTKISCEWYEYKTKPAIVCDDSDVVSDMQDYLTTNSRQSIGNSNIPYGFCFGNEYAYNGVLADGLISEIYSTYLNRLYYLFYSSSLGSITSDSIANYVYDYDKSFDSGTIEVNGSSISNDLFTSSVDSGRTLGYNKKTLDNENSGDWFDMPDYDSTHSAWQKFWDFGFFSPTTDQSFEDVLPIVKYDGNDWTDSSSEYESKYFINKDDVNSFKTNYLSRDSYSSMYFFRFALTDYYSVDGTCYEGNGTYGYYDTQASAYLFQTTVFLGFDIIELTFKNAVDYVSIPAVMSPIDVFSTATPPLADVLPELTEITDFWEEFQWIISIILLVAIIILAYPLLKWLIKGLVWLLKIIFYPITLIFKRGKK